MKILLICATLLIATSALTIGDEGMKLHKVVVVNVPLEQAWNSWTTEEGTRTFFCPKANIELTPGGPYEILFFPDAPEGQRGAEGLKVLTVDPMNSLSFEWNAPPNWPNIREKAPHTRVTLHFESMEDGKIQVSLIHDKWGEGLFEGESWQEVYDYFDQAWDSVLRRFIFSIEERPLDWENEGFSQRADQYQERIAQLHK